MFNFIKRKPRIVTFIINDDEMTLDLDNVSEIIDDKCLLTIKLRCGTAFAFRINTEERVRFRAAFFAFLECE